MTSPSGKVAFWQTNFLAGGEGGHCAVKFGFDGSDLAAAIDGLALRIRIFSAAGADLGVSELRIRDRLGGTHHARYVEGTFLGPERWASQDDGALSPLCDPRVRLQVEAAVGRQNGQRVDLVRFKQLEYTSFPRVTVNVKH